MYCAPLISSVRLDPAVEMNSGGSVHGGDGDENGCARVCACLLEKGRALALTTRAADDRKHTLATINLKWARASATRTGWLTAYVYLFAFCPSNRMWIAVRFVDARSKFGVGIHSRAHLRR